MPGVGGQWTQKTEGVNGSGRRGTWGSSTVACSSDPQTEFQWKPNVPVSMPWASNSQGLMNFTGGTVQAPFHTGDPDRGLRCKRRLAKEDLDLNEPSSKHFLSEEMMAAQFHCLSLNNDHRYGSNGFPIKSGSTATDRLKWQQWLIDYNRFQELEGRLRLEEEEDDEGAESDAKKNVIVEGIFDMNDSPVISVSPALQESLSNASDSILPEMVLRSLGHPCMEMVLWKPPGRIIQETICAFISGSETTLGSQVQKKATEKEGETMTTETAADCSRPSLFLDRSTKMQVLLPDCDEEMEL